MRFQPDTWLEALLRPIAMAAPDANVYVEIMAPDFRFACVFALLAVLAVLSLRARRSRTGAAGRSSGAAASRTTFVLLAAMVVAFVPWLATSGNGRYFLPALLMAGPLCVGLAWLLPLTRGCRLAIAVMVVALQAFAVQQTSPWQAWAMTTWREGPYFEVDIPADVRDRPATYVTMAAISYSAVAPLFHPDSRWISLHNAPEPGGSSADSRRTAAFLAKAQPGRLMLLVPVVEGTLTKDRLPDTSVSAALDTQLSRYGLALARPQACRFLHSRTLADIGLGKKTAEERAQSGFWLCRLAHTDKPAGGGAAHSSRYDAVFKHLEDQCPDLFPAGGDHGTVALPHGEMRSYGRGEMKAYVYDDGDVFYKYYRALNPVRVGAREDVLAGKSRVECTKIRGRAGLPWDREI